MSSKFYVGGDVISSTDNGKYKPISRITLYLDDNKCLTAGDDTGHEIVADCPHATQEMVNALLANMKGHEYQAFAADEANIDPAAELGDGITVGGMYGGISRIMDDGMGYPSLSAPGAAELEDEYPMEGPMTRMFNRELAKAYSLIAKTAEEISLSIHDLSGNVTQLSLTIDGVTVTDSYGTTKIKGDRIETETLCVDAANITGELTADKINATNLKVSAANVIGTLTTAYISADQITAGTFAGSDLILDGLLTISGRGYIGGGIGGADGSRTYGAVLTDLTASNGILATNAGAKLFSSVCELSVHNTGVTSYGKLFPGVSGTYSLGGPTFLWSEIYASTSTITTSDREKKNSISYDLSKYEKLFQKLLPGSYKFNDGTSGRTHTGFVSQDVETALAESDLDSLDFAGFIKSPKVDEDGNVIANEYDYALRYEEFVALNTHMIQKLMARVAELEERINEV